MCTERRFSCFLKSLNGAWEGDKHDRKAQDNITIQLVTLGPVPVHSSCRWILHPKSRKAAFISLVGARCDRLMAFWSSSSAPASKNAGASSLRRETMFLMAILACRCYRKPKAKRTAIYASFHSYRSSHTHRSSYLDANFQSMILQHVDQKWSHRIDHKSLCIFWNTQAESSYCRTSHFGNHRNRLKNSNPPESIKN